MSTMNKTIYFNKKVEYTEENSISQCDNKKKVTHFRATRSDSSYVQVQLWRGFLGQNPSDTMCQLCDFG